MFWRQAARLLPGVVPTTLFAKHAIPAVQMTAQATRVVVAAQTTRRATFVADAVRMMRLVIPVAVVVPMTLPATIAAAVVLTMRPIMRVVTIQRPRLVLLPTIAVVDVAKAADVVAVAMISADIYLF